MRKDLVYILDADSGQTSRIKMRFLTEGFNARAFLTAQEILAQSCLQPPELILGVACAPDDSLELCVRVREKSDAVIIFLGENWSDMEKISVLGAGADLCMPIPFSDSVLIAYIHACLRRSRRMTAGDEKAAGQKYLVDSPLIKIDVKSRTVIVNYNPVTLTAREFDILALLASHPDQVFYTHQIFQSVWDADSILSGDDRPVAVHISNLRKKIEADPLRPRHIITMRGVGYKFQI